MNFIQYIDDTYTVKVKDVGEAVELGYVVSGIKTPFFILSVFIDNKRVQGVSFGNYDSLPMLSVINDLGNVDLNVISENDFAIAFTQMNLIIPYSNGFSAVEISNFSDFQKKPLRYLKEYKLPQFRLDGRFSEGSGYSFDPRVYSLMRLGTIQGNSKFYVDSFSTYRNTTHLDYLEFQGGNPNYIQNGYGVSDFFPVQNNGSIVQFGDYYIKFTTTKISYPYGLMFSIFTDIRTNEFWILADYIEIGTGAYKKAEFDLSTLVCVNGGFKIKNLLHEVEIQISNIYG